jgi:hypothetical protein
LYTPCFKGRIATFDWPAEEVWGILQAYSLQSRMCQHLFSNVRGLKIVLLRPGKATSGAAYGATAGATDDATAADAAAQRFDAEVSFPVAKPCVDYDSAGKPQIYVADTRDPVIMRWARQRFRLKRGSIRAGATAVVAFEAHGGGRGDAAMMPAGEGSGALSAEAVLARIRELRRAGSVRAYTAGADRAPRRRSKKDRARKKAKKGGAPQEAEREIDKLEL